MAKSARGDDDRNLNSETAPDGLQPDDIEAEEATELPDREAMSFIQLPGPVPAPEPFGTFDGDPIESTDPPVV
jgi:hypothetical protein